MASSQEKQKSHRSVPSSSAGATSRVSSSRRAKISPAFVTSSARRKRDEDARLQKLASENGEPDPPITNLPLDVLASCFVHLDSIFQIGYCARVCRAWKEATLLDVMWKKLYLRWHSPDAGVSPEQAVLPSSCLTWREAFRRHFNDGKRSLRQRTVEWGKEAGYIQLSDSQVSSFTPGISFQELADKLQLSFYIRINNSPQLKLKGRQAAVFPASCILHCPFKLLKRRMKLSSLKSVEVIVSSDTLSKFYSKSRFTTGNVAEWRSDVLSGTTLRLVRLPVECSSASLIVGTLPESTDNETFQHEEVLFVKAALHLSEIIALFLGCCNNPWHLVQGGHPDPAYGLYGYHVSVQLHNFEKLVWSREFPSVIWDPDESVAGETAVFRLIPSFELVPEKVSLPWRSEAFSGEVENNLMMSLTLWDVRRDMAWESVELFQLRPHTLPTVEYGLPEFEGLQFQASVADMRTDITVTMECSIPVYNSETLFAITDMRMLLGSKFLRQWFGFSRI